MADKGTKNQVKEITDRLEQGIKDLFTTDKYAEYLRVMSRFSTYSTRNTMLIYLQKPDATRVAGFRTWETDFGRYVQKGQKGIKILAPTPFTIKEEKQKIDPNTRMPILDRNGIPVTEEVERHLARFKVIHVFDVSQTDGKPLPTLAESLTGDVRNYGLFLDALRAVSPFPISFEALSPDVDGACNLTDRTIAIREGMSEIQTVSAVIHEITHAKLHDIEAQRLLDDTAKRKDRRTEEVEAESVSYAVCQFYGIETGANSFGYVASWGGSHDMKELNASLDTIRKTAAELIDGIDKQYRALAKERGVDLTVNAGTPALDGVTVTADAPATADRPENRRYTEEFFGNSYADVLPRVLTDAEYLNDRNGTDAGLARAGCDAAVERAVRGLFPEKLELFAFYMGDAGFKARLADSVFQETYTNARKQLDAVRAAEDSEQVMPAGAKERRNYEKFAELFPRVASGEYRYMRLEAGEAFMPLSVQNLGDNSVSIMHTYTLNGDLCYDPDVTVKIDNEAKTLTASTFEQSLPPVYQYLDEEGIGHSVDGSGNERIVNNLQAKIDDFLETFLENISQQDYTPVRALMEIDGGDVEITFDERGNPVMPGPEDAAPEAEPTPEAELVPKPEKRYELGFGHMGNGLTVWNRLEEKDGDYVTVAHIGPDRSVTFYDKDMPDSVKARIEREARTSDARVSATQQDRHVFNTPPQDAAREDIRLFAADFYGFMTSAYHNGLPPLSQKDIELSISEIADSITGGGAAAIREGLTAAIKNTAFPEQASALLTRLGALNIPGMSDRLQERQTAETAPEPPTAPAEAEPGIDLYPDPAIGPSEMNLYGYTDPTMLPLLQDRAVELFNAGHVIYMLNPDNTEAAAFDTDELTAHGGIFGIDKGEWRITREYAAMKAEAENGEGRREADFLYGDGNRYGLYQVKDGGDLRDYRFASLKELEAGGLDIRRGNYELVYSAPFADRVEFLTDRYPLLNRIYAELNIERPEDFRGRSPSVSDVIALKYNGDYSSHYADSTGFVEIDGFLGEERATPPQTVESQTYSQAGNTFAESGQSAPNPQPAPEYTGPGAAAFEADVKAGRSISITDYAKAINAERGDNHGGPQVRRKGRQSLYDRLDANKKLVAAQSAGGAPAHNKNREV